MGVTDLDLLVLDAIRGIDPLPQVPIMFRFMGMAQVRTQRDLMSLLLFLLEILTVTLLQWKVWCLSGCATVSAKEKVNSLHPIQRTLTRLQLSLKPWGCHALVSFLEYQDDEFKGDVQISYVEIICEVIKILPRNICPRKQEEKGPVKPMLGI